MADHAWPRAPRALCYIRDHAAKGDVRDEAEQRRMIEDVKRGPEHPVHHPGPAAVRELLTRQDVAAPPELLAEDVENDEGASSPHEQPPSPGRWHAEKLFAARHGHHERRELLRRGIELHLLQRMEHLVDERRRERRERTDREAPHSEPPVEPTDAHTPAECAHRPP